VSGIDILAVIDRAAGGLFAAQGVMPGDLMQARAAVEKLMADRAELLEAARMALADCCDLIETDAGRALQAAIARAAGGGHD